MNADNRLAYLFHLYYNREATPEQVAELFELLKAANDVHLTELMHNEWNALNDRDAIFSTEKTEQMLSQILNARKLEVVDMRHNPWRGWLKVAAVFIISVSACIYFLTKKQGNENTDSKNARSA